MKTHISLCTWTVTIALLLCSGIVVKASESSVNVEEATESPIADMALVETPMMGANTEAAAAAEAPKQEKPVADSAQPHTIADFVIHPLIALRPRVPEEPLGEGKQADGTTTPAPFQIFGINPGQGLIGSSVSSLAGTLSGWLGNRIQLPGILESPVTETSTTTTTTTTPRPDVVVRVQQRPATRKPLIQLDDASRPHRFGNNNFYDSEEYDDEYDDDYFDRDEYDDEDDDHDDEDDDEVHRGDNDEDDEEDEDNELEEDERPVRKRKNKNKKSNGNSSSSSSTTKNKRKNKKKANNSNKKRNENRRQKEEKEEEEEESREESDDEDNSGETPEYDEDDNSQEFFYNNNNNHHASTKRSQNQQGFIQLSQQNLLNQIRQLTRGQTPGEVGATLRKGSSTSSSGSKRRTPATLIINRNGQTVYLAPELMEASQGSSNKVVSSMYTTSSVPAKKRPNKSPYPQPPLTVPLRRKGQPTQYITIPWSQLGISSPSQLVSVSEGIQTQPLILNIPQSAIESMQFSNKPKKPQQGQLITPEAVPLLAEASLMDVFKPPQIPPARTPSATRNSIRMAASVTPVIITTKGKTRVRSGTIVEKAPDMETMDNQQMDDSMNEEDTNETEHQFLVVGEDAEAGLGRQVIPVMGESRNYHAFNPYIHLFQNRPFNLRRGRDLQEESMGGGEMKENEMMAESANVMPMDENQMMMGEGEMKESEKMAESTNVMPMAENQMMMEAVPAKEMSAMPIEEAAKEVSEMKVEPHMEAVMMADHDSSAKSDMEMPVMENSNTVEPAMMATEAAKEVMPMVKSTEQMIPVQVINEPEPEVMKTSDMPVQEIKPEETKSE
ncbi:uncharacterized protein LOC142231467 [Haematobia irritans]|uniref:uncharacterized protein LOC142231467 n=1 Tax=Haematobia irritans TaxID=7368 RepID=UPI003F4FCCE8